MNSLSFHWITVTFCIFVLPEPAASSCAEILTGRKGQIKTPNFPGDYDNNLDCIWTITVENGELIVIDFIEFEIEAHVFYCPDKFSVYDGPDTYNKKQLILQPCGYTKPEPLHSTGNVLTLTFTSNSKTKKKGVSLKWRVSDTFTLHTQAKTWTEANNACLNDGGHLAVKSDLNQQLILNLIGDRDDSLWIGEYYTPWIWLQGCYKDPDFNLTSSKPYVETKENEAKVCQHHCQDTVYFGMKGLQCYCLTTEDIDRLVFSRSVIECQTPCSGNNKERCGGVSSITVYMNDVCWKNSSTWVAKISNTISGKTCQAWSSDFPHAHAFHDDDMFPDGSEALASNYCRDPDGKGAPWCFTTDPSIPWQFCDAPPCPGTCWSDPTKYSGLLNVSVHGHKCANWTDDPPSRYKDYRDASLFPDATVAEAFNYCRSPDEYPSLWCFIDGRFDFCGAPPCFETESMFMVPDGKDSSGLVFVQHSFSDARAQCRLTYALSNYKNLFGLSDYIELEKTILGSRPRHWLGNVRGEDTTSYEKGGVLKCSACRTIRKIIFGDLKTKLQSNCHIRLGFVCQKDALLCGDKFYNDSGIISSPRYPDNYDDNEYCEWEIHVTERKAIEILFHEIDIEKHTNCSFDYVEVFEDHTRLGKLCGELSNVLIISASDHVFIKFRSDKEVQGKGFNLTWTSAPTSTTYSSRRSTPAPKNGQRRETDKLTDGVQKTDSTLSGATLAGIIVGVVLALIVVIGIVLVVFVLRRKKQEKIESETIMQLKALESTSAATTPSNAETLQQDVYSSPIPKAFCQPKQSISEKATVPDTDDTYYHHLHQTNVKRPSPDDTGNPYQGLHSPELYDHTPNLKPNQNDDNYDRFDSNKNDALDKACLQQNQNVYDCTTTSVALSSQSNALQAGKTGSLDKERNENVDKGYMSVNSKNESGKPSTKVARTDNYLTPTDAHMNDLTGHAASADIQENDRIETDGNVQEVDIEEDTYYNVSDDKSDEHDCADQHLYEIDDTGHVYEIV